MPTSKFRLQSVLDYRQTLIDTARLELSGLHIRCAEEEALLWSLRASERQVIADLSEQQRVIVNMPDVMRLNEHLNVLGRRIGVKYAEGYLSAKMIGIRTFDAFIQNPT